MSCLVVLFVGFGVEDVMKNNVLFLGCKRIGRGNIEVWSVFVFFFGL